MKVILMWNNPSENYPSFLWGYFHLFHTRLPCIRWFKLLKCVIQFNPGITVWRYARVLFYKGTLECQWFFFLFLQVIALSRIPNVSARMRNVFCISLSFKKCDWTPELLATLFWEYMLIKHCVCVVAIYSVVLTRNFGFQTDLTV